jgi:hypothetical protein
VNRLPEKYCAAVVLGYLEALTHEQAADRLRCPIGTVRSRLSWARQRLRMRLTRRGLAPAVALAALELSRSALVVPEVLTECTVQSGLQLAVGDVPQAAVSAPAWFLTRGVIRTMILARWKATAAVLMTMGIAVAGAGSLALQAQDAEPPPEAAQDKSAGRNAEIDQKIEFLKDSLRALRERIEQT